MSAASSKKLQKLERIISQICASIADLGGRTSPDDHPDALLVTAKELSTILRNYLGGDAGIAVQLVLDDIAIERHRQIDVEHFNASHDDEYKAGELPRAAAAYALAAAVDDATRAWVTDQLPRSQYGWKFLETLTLVWPVRWSRTWFKPKDRRHDLVRAGALIVAEIERLDRGAA